MRTFTCLLSDTRYSVPTLLLVLAPDVEKAREIARRELEANACHQRFELHDHERLIWAEQR